MIERRGNRVGNREDPEEELAEDSSVPSIDSIHENRGGEDTVTGMSVSIPTDGYAPQALINLLRTFFSRQKLLNAMMKGGAIRVDQELVDRLAEEKPDTAERIQEILRNEIDAGMCEGVHLEDGKLTVDFPFDESDPTAWTAYSKVIIAMADRAKAQRNASAAAFPEDSEMKYFCRSWLIQLGFGGPEHRKTGASCWDTCTIRPSARPTRWTHTKRSWREARNAPPGRHRTGGDRP